MYIILIGLGVPRGAKCGKAPYFNQIALSIYSWLIVWERVGEKLLPVLTLPPLTMHNTWLCSCNQDIVENVKPY